MAETGGVPPAGSSLAALVQVTGEYVAAQATMLEPGIRKAGEIIIGSAAAQSSARDLGVRYVLEGSVRKVANRVRMTGQLIDATNGAHIWADRFESAVDDIFGLIERRVERQRRFARGRAQANRELALTPPKTVLQGEPMLGAGLTSPLGSQKDVAGTKQRCSMRAALHDSSCGTLRLTDSSPATRS
jgi:hypothetical protein